MRMRMNIEMKAYMQCTITLPFKSRTVLMLIMIGAVKTSSTREVFKASKVAKKS